MNRPHTRAAQAAFDERENARAIRPLLEARALLASLLLVVAACSGGEPTPVVPAADRLNVVFVSFDTTRQDHLSLYGYDRPTSPHLDRLATKGAVFENAVAQMTITNPSHASMMTGLYPHTHGVGENTRRLPEEIVTLAELLAGAGYATGAFVSGHPLRREITGLTQGFEHYDSEFTRRRDGRETTDAALAWLGGQGGARPFFLFVHYYDAHGRFRPRGEHQDLFRSASPGRELEFVPEYQQVRDEAGRVVKDLNFYVDRYDALLRYQDELFAEILEVVDLEQTLVIVVSDHGETLGERPEVFNLNHGTAVFEEQIAIPFVLRGPGVRAGRFATLAETVDILPTVVDLLDLAVVAFSPPLDGRSLLPDLAGQERTDETAFASNRTRPQMYRSVAKELVKGEFIETVRRGPLKLVRYPTEAGEQLELFDLEQDPLEMHDLSAALPNERDQLRQVLSTWSRRMPLDELPPQSLSEEELEALEALGYVDAGDG